MSDLFAPMRGLSLRLRLVITLLAGVAFGLGQAPFDLTGLALPALLVPFLMLSPEVCRRQAGWIGWAFGVGYFGTSLTWIVNPFQVDAATTGWMAPFALVLIAAGLAIFWAMPFWLAASSGLRWLVVPLWTLAELSRAYILTGFPWGLVGYVWTPTIGAQWAAVIGPHGLTLLTLTIAWLASEVSRTRALPLGLAAIVLAIGLIGGGVYLQNRPIAPQEGTPKIVRLVQPNAPQDQKWQRDMIPVFFNRLLSFTEVGPRPDLIIWPETAMPMLLNNAEEALGVVSQSAGPVPMIVGIQREDDGRYYNSLILQDASGQTSAVYDKHHLVPFGEYMPFPDLFARINVGGLAQRAASGYSAGPGPRLLDLGPLGKALPLICYEAVFPQHAKTGGSRPDMLIQITNDAWFGTWSGPYQHLAQARMRAIEQGLPMLRSANTGVSAVIDAKGRIVDSIDLGQAGYIDVPLPAALNDTIYSRSGDVPLLVLLLGLTLVGALRARSNSH